MLWQRTKCLIRRYSLFNDSTVAKVKENSRDHLRTKGTDAVVQAGDLQPSLCI